MRKFLIKHFLSTKNIAVLPHKFVCTNAMPWAIFDFNLRNIDYFILFKNVVYNMYIVCEKV